MSFKEGKKDGEVVMECNEKGCGKTITGKSGRGKLWVAARAAGWKTPNASTHYCPDHAAAHGGRTPKAEKPAKKGAKVTKKAPTAKKGPKVVEFG